MDYFELTQISTQHLELTTPASPEKLWTIGQYLGLDDQKRVIDFGCGYGRTLSLWAENFGVSGIGIDIHQFLSDRATERIAEAGFTDRLKIVCQNPVDYQFDPASFDVAVCLGATFNWGGYQKAVENMKPALTGEGKIVIGEPYYTQPKVPSELVKYEGDLHTEFELFEITRSVGFDIEFVVRASRDDWDRFVSANWYGLLRWIDENNSHPDRNYVIDQLHKQQEMYFKYQRKHEGWAIYILNPVQYKN